MEETNIDQIDNGSTHPLLLPPVTSKIMEFLCVRDLVRSRGVCHQFNRSACLSLRQKKTIKFRMKLENLEQYTITMLRSTHVPYTRYELEFFDMGDPIVIRFLKLFGDTITTLQLNYCRSSSIQIADLLNSTPNLTSFWMNCDPVDDLGSIFTRLNQPYLPNLNSLSLVGEYSQNKSLISELIQTAINLESLQFRCYDLTTETSPFELMCFDVLCNLPKRQDISFNNNNNESFATSNQSFVSPLKKLKKFQMHYRLDNQQICRLSQMQLSLSHLHLSINCDGDNMVAPQPLYNLLQGLQYTLTNLDLDFGMGTGSREKLYQFPVLHRLSRLVLSEFKGSSLSILMNRCPSIKNLSLVNCCGGSYDPSFFDFQSGYEPLESLVLTTLIDQVAIIKQISCVFPNLSALDIRLTNETLRKVFETMPKLTELTLCAAKMNDEGFTGIDELDLNCLTLELEDEQEEDDDLMEDGPKPKSTKLRRFPYIGQLEQLRVVKINDASNLSDSTVIHGLIQCKNLTSMSLQNSQITDISLRAIAERLTRLRRFESLSSNAILTIQGKTYIRTNLPLCDFILGHQDLQQIYCPKKFTSQMEMFLDLFSN